MSFTSNVKTEICGLKLDRSDYLAELSAFFRSSSKLIDNKIEVSSENVTVAKRMYLLLKEIYGIDAKIDKRKYYNFRNRNLYVLVVEQKIESILSDLQIYDNDQKIEKPKEYMIDTDEEKKSYLRGSFLSSGSINDPKNNSSYHLEFFYDSSDEAVFVQRILNSFDLNFKLITRGSVYVIYIKDSEKISDFLKLISAFNAVLYFENIKAYREQKNNINRINNFEQANIDKIIETSNKQLDYINKIEEKLGFDFLDDKLKVVAIYRKKYPEVSLQELSEIINIETEDKITKSGLNHRLKKIKDLAEKIR